MHVYILCIKGAKSLKSNQGRYIRWRLKKSEGDKKANYKAIRKKDYSRQKEHQVERP